MNRRERRKETWRKEAEERLSRKHKQCKLRYLRMAPRKVRAVIDIIRGMQVEKAIAVLDFTQRGAARPLAKMLRAAVANASSAEHIDVDALFIKEISVDQGPVLKRFLPRAMGRATMVQKKTSHVSCLLEERA